MPKHRIRITAALALCLLTSPLLAQTAAPYPNRPIRMVVASAPGGILDTVGRIVATRIGESMGQPVVVENRAGAGGILGTELVVKAAGDGYTIGKVATSHAINPGLYPKMPYDTVRDLIAVSHTVNLTNILVAHPSVPASSVRELIALARARPATLTFGSAGTASPITCRARSSARWRASTSRTSPTRAAPRRSPMCWPATSR